MIALHYILAGSLLTFALFRAVDGSWGWVAADVAVAMLMVVAARAYSTD